MLTVEGKTEFAMLIKRTTMFDIGAIHFNLVVQCTLLVFLESCLLTIFYAVLCFRRSLNCFNFFQKMNREFLRSLVLIVSIRSQ